MKTKMKRLSSLLLTLCLTLSLCLGSAYAANRMFSDSAGHWAEDIIQELAERGIIAGYPDGTVKPDNIITRGEFCALLARYLELDATGAEKETPTFSDIDGNWSEANIEALVDAGIINPGDYDGSFRSTEPITRIEIIRMMVRSIHKGDAAEAYTGGTGFSDDSALNGADKGYAHYADDSGLVKGYPDNTIRPDDESTRAEAFALLERQKDAADKAAEEAKKNQKDSGSGSSSGGGSVSYPKAQVSFELPVTAHTDTAVPVVATAEYAKSITWSLTKATADDGQEPLPLSDAVSGPLTDSGGSITFKSSGSYTLTATAVNSAGRETVYSQTVTVYPVIDVSFDLPETTHTDKTVTIAESAELGNLSIAWSVIKDGVAAELDSVISGSLGNGGGTVQFTDKGSYTLTASATDETGRSFTHSETVAVHPVPDVAFELPATTHTDTTIKLGTTLTEMDGLTAEWSLTRGGEAVALSDYIDGTLTNDGGSIRFIDKGVYTLTATVTDTTGRTFETSSSVTVYPVGAVGFYLPEIVHTDEAVAVEATFTNIDTATAEWTLTRNGVAASRGDYVDGTLTNDGGSIRFTQKGEYVLTASFTDGAGRSYSYSQTVTAYPVPALTFSLPESVHTDTDVVIDADSTDMDGLTVEWMVDNTYGFQDWDTYISGDLTNDGGTIRFKHAGVYELVARVTDATGRVFLFEPGDKIEVLPVLTIQFNLPETTYPDRTVDLRTTGNNNVLPVEWALTKDGKSVSLSTYIKGTLNAQGGKIQFADDGEYVLTATMTDALGRTFSYNDSITVYPISEIELTLPQTGYAGETTTVSVSGTHLDNLTTVWTVSKDGGEAAPYSDYVSGTLSSDGGSIAFNSKGSYILTLTMTDALGRAFSESSAITVYPIPEMQISLPALNYSTEAIAVGVSGTEMDGLNIDWRISINGGAAVPYTSVAAGTLSESGGTITLSTNTTATVQFIATGTDAIGRSFTFKSNTAALKPIAECSFTLPASVHIGKAAAVTITDSSSMEGSSIVWSLTKDGSTASYNGTLSNSGGSITISAAGTYKLTATVTDSEGRVFSHSENITVTNTAPSAPTASATPTRSASNGKFLVNFSASSTDPDGDAVTYEWDGTSADGYYAAGTYTVKVRAKDAWGLYSGWTEVNFTVSNSAPTTPVITRSPSGNSVSPGTAVTITAASTDPDGDAITYVWDGRLAETSTGYPLGKNIVKVKAVDSSGAESSWAAIIFFVADSSHGGGMTLTGPESTIIEDGVQGATITKWTFTVPSVSGHNANYDYGQVRGYNIQTGQWEQLKMVSFDSSIGNSFAATDGNTGRVYSNNGVYMYGTLTPGVYSKLEFYYYTPHNCMYNKSNITYSVEFYWSAG